MEQPGILQGVGFRIGPLEVTGSVITTWLVMALLALASWLATRRPQREPRGLQLLLEGFLLAIDDAIRGVLPNHTELVFPFVATLWIYIGVANLVGLIPGLTAPTADLSVTSALALLTFLSVHWFGIRAEGVRRHLAHYLSPSPILLPFHLISEVSRTLALAIRLFGNVMSLELAAFLVLLVAGLLAPVPLLMLHIVEAIIQAYIFGVLALIYIAGGIQSEALRRQKEEKGALHE